MKPRSCPAISTSLASSRNSTRNTRVTVHPCVAQPYPTSSRAACMIISQRITTIWKHAADATPVYAYQTRTHPSYLSRHESRVGVHKNVGYGWHMDKTSSDKIPLGDVHQEERKLAMILNLDGRSTSTIPTTPAVGIKRQLWLLTTCCCIGVGKLPKDNDRIRKPDHRVHAESLLLRSQGRKLQFQHEPGEDR